MKKISLALLRYALLALLLYYMFNGLEAGLVWKALTHYSVAGILFVFIAVLVSDIAMAYRLRLFANKSFSMLASFEAVTISGLFNFILPAKLGELSKVVYLKKIYGFYLHRAFAILIYERFWDVMLLMMLTVVAFALLMDQKSAYLFAGSTILIGSVFLVMLNKRLIKRITGFFPLKFFRVYGRKVLFNIVAVKKEKGILFSFMITLLVWVSFFLPVYVFFIYVVDFNLDIVEIFAVFVISSIAMSIPVMPGGVGTYQAGMVFALGLYGVGKEEALMAGVMLHLMMLIPSFLAAWIVFETKGLTLKMFKEGL